MKYLDKAPFPIKTGQRRDCGTKNHWPRVSKKLGYECVFCGQKCTIDGKGAEVGK